MSMRVLKTVGLLAVAGALCSPVVSASEGGDAEKGQVIFEQLCSYCHGVSADGSGPTMGPNLYGLVGRRIASEPNFQMYSASLKAHDEEEWDFKILDEFLSDPEKKVPGTTMAVKLEEKGDREALIAYLESLE